MIGQEDLTLLINDPVVLLKGLISGSIIYGPQEVMDVGGHFFGRCGKRMAHAVAGLVKFGKFYSERFNLGNIELSG